MLEPAAVLALSLSYLAVLFAVASWGDRHADRGRSVIGSPWIYTLSLAVYCTAWTFYGSVGLAAQSGLAFLPVFLGPTLGALGFVFLLPKIIRIAKAYGITSIADFIAARFGKSGLLAGLVTIVAAIGAIPYISIQLKAVSVSIVVAMGGGGQAHIEALGLDVALIVTLVMAAFAILKSCTILLSSTSQYSASSIFTVRRPRLGSVTPLGNHAFANALKSCSFLAWSSSSAALPAMET